MNKTEKFASKYTLPGFAFIFWLCGVAFGMLLGMWLARAILLHNI